MLLLAFIVILHHILIGLLVHWGLSRGLLLSHVLQLHDDPGLVVPSGVLRNRLLLLHLFVGEPQVGVLFEEGELLCGHLLHLHLVLEEEDHWLPGREAVIPRIGHHHSHPEIIHCALILLLLDHFGCWLEEILGLLDSSREGLSFLSRKDNTIPGIGLICHIPRGMLCLGLLQILLLLLTQRPNLFGVFLQLIIANPLQLLGLKHPLRGELLDRFGESLQIDPGVVD